MKSFCMIASFLLATVLGFGQATTGLPAPQLNGTGVPSSATPIAYACAAALNNVLFVQLDATQGGRLWLCSNASGTFIWEHLVGAIGSGIGATVATGSFLAIGCNSTVNTITVTGAVVVVNASIVTPIYTVAPTNSNAGFLYIPSWVSAANTVSFQVCSLGLLTGYPSFIPKALLY